LEMERSADVRPVINTGTITQGRTGPSRLSKQHGIQLRRMQRSNRAIIRIAEPLLRKG
jgi:hypothetical protein